MGRTGKMWAADHFGVTPDIFTVAKGIASGLPLSAMVARAEVMNWGPGAHASTFGGNPVAVAAALATVELLERELVANSARIGGHILDRLRSWPAKFKTVGDVTISRQRLFSKLSVFFGLLAGLLVATGLYGTLAYRVNNRTVEIGVRLAVGAQREQVLWMILRESLGVAVIGVGVGLPLAFLTSRLLRSMLFGVGPNDPLSFIGALVAVTLVVVAASLIPARRAASIDPMKALRAE